jgi:hypothetical protein
MSAGPDGHSWDLRTDTGAHVQVSLARADVLRIWAGPAEALAGPGDKAAAIVVGTPAAEVAHTVEETPSHITIKTAALSLRIERKPLRFTLFRAGDETPLWRELQPLDIGAKQAVQVLSSDAGERFFGGGQQNGRYEFKGRELQVSYSGGWEEGDRPNPAPFLLSSKGWGMLRKPCCSMPKAASTPTTSSARTCAARSRCTPTGPGARACCRAGRWNTATPTATTTATTSRSRAPCRRDGATARPARPRT